MQWLLLACAGDMHILAVYHVQCAPEIYTNMRNVHSSLPWPERRLHKPISLGAMQSGLQKFIVP